MRILRQKKKIVCPECSKETELAYKLNLWSGYLCPECFTEVLFHASLVSKIDIETNKGLIKAGRPELPAEVIEEVLKTEGSSRKVVEALKEKGIKIHRNSVCSIRNRK